MFWLASACLSVSGATASKEQSESAEVGLRGPTVFDIESRAKNRR